MRKSIELQEDEKYFLDEIGINCIPKSFDEIKQILKRSKEYPELRKKLIKNASLIKKIFNNNKKRLKKYFKNNFDFKISFNNIKLTFMKFDEGTAGEYNSKTKEIIIHLLLQDKNYIYWTISHELFHHVFKHTNFKQYLEEIYKKSKEKDIKCREKILNEFNIKHKIIKQNLEKNIDEFFDVFGRKADIDSSEKLNKLLLNHMEINKYIYLNFSSEINKLLNFYPNDLRFYSSYNDEKSSFLRHLKKILNIIDKEIKILKKEIDNIKKNNIEEKKVLSSVLEEVIHNLEEFKKIVNEIKNNVNKLINPLIERLLFYEFFPTIFEEGLVETLTYLYLKERGFKEEVLDQLLNDSGYEGNIKMIKILSKEMNLNELTKQVFKEENEKKNEELINLAIKASHALIISESIKESKKFQELKKISDETMYPKK